MIRAAVIALTLGLAAPAAATPPDMVGLRDELFGVSAEYVFLLRYVFDNHGVYESEQRDLLLVALNRRTRTETIWPVYRARHGADYERGNDLGRPYRIDPITVEGQVDPFAKLREMQGMPIGPAWMRDSTPARVEPGDRMVTLTDEAGRRFGQDIAALRQARATALTATADAIGDYPRMNQTTIHDLLGTLDEWQQDCIYTDGYRFSSELGAAPTAMLRVTCTDGEDGQEWSLLMLVPPLE